MGSRNKQRYGGSSSRSRSGGSNSGDNVGNRRSFKETRVPAEDIGNRSDSQRRADSIRDDIGNSIDAAPTHSLSGVMGSEGKPRRNKETAQSHVRVGRYIVGGVNPIIAGGNHFEQNEENFESKNSGFYRTSSEGPNTDSRASKNKKRRKKRHNDPREDSGLSSDSAEKRLKRLFDFDDDDRFEYVLSSDPEKKRLFAKETVETILEKSLAKASVESILLKKDTRQSVLVVLDEKGSEEGVKPLYNKGSIELTALNFIVNKIVNRYPNDRIRLAVLPKADEEGYVKNFHAVEAITSTAAAEVTGENL